MNFFNILLLSYFLSISCTKEMKSASKDYHFRTAFSFHQVENRIAKILSYFSDFSTTSDTKSEVTGKKEFLGPLRKSPYFDPSLEDIIRFSDQEKMDIPLNVPMQVSNGVNIMPPPPCITDDSQLAFVNGQLSATQTLYNCLANVADPGMIPTYYNGSYNGILLMNSTMVLNNLERIDEVEGTARLQFSLRLQWRDDRLSMPNFWEKVSPLTQSAGMDLTNIFITNTSIVIWTPVLRFTDASDVEFQVEYLKFNSSNVFQMGIGVDCTLLQPNFNFEKYPWDAQAVAVRFNIFSMPASLAELGYWGGNGLVFNFNYDGKATFKENAIWNFDSYWYTTYEGNYYNYWYYVINVSRRGEGIVLRLVLPITLLLCLAALTFWIVHDNRVDTTITLLLSVSALYIVILGNIPLLGYLTDVDKFVFAMFFLLVVIVAAHQWYVTLLQKEDQWPLRPVVMRMIEVVGRTAMVPAIVIYFLRHVYRQTQTAPSTIAMTTAVLVVFLSIFWREMFGLRKVFLHALIKLLEKVNDPKVTVKDISWLELLVVNAVVFRKFSWSNMFLATHLHFHGAIDIEPYMAVSTKMQNVNLLSQLHGNNGKNNKNESSPMKEQERKFDRSSTTRSDPYIFASNMQHQSSSPSSKNEGDFRLSLSSNGIQLKELKPTTSAFVSNPLRESLSDARRNSSIDVDSDDET